MTRLERAPAGTSAAQVADGARERGAAAHVVDGTGRTSKRAVLDGVAEALAFPDWAGRNLDAVFDCLIDLSWLPAGEHVLVWASPDALAEADPAAYEAVESVLADAVERGAPERLIRVVLADC